MPMFFTTNGIKDLTFPTKYSEGQALTLTAGEAEQFSQTYFENCRNSLAPKVKKILEKCLDAESEREQVQTLFLDRAATYELCAKGQKGSEIEKTMAEIAREWAKAELKGEGLPRTKDSIAKKTAEIFDDDEDALRECAVASIAAAAAARSRPIKGESDLTESPED